MKLTAVRNDDTTIEQTEIKYIVSDGLWIEVWLNDGSMFILNLSLIQNFKITGA